MSKKRTKKTPTSEQKTNQRPRRYFYRFLHLDLVDLDAEQFMFKIIVEVETVSVLHVFPSRVLVEDACLSAGQRLQRALELSLFCEG